MKTLGIIGGMSPESTLTYYQQINRLVNQAKGANYTAPLLMVSVEFEQIVRLQKEGNWQKAGQILAEAAGKLEQIGADGILLATNTMHKVADQITAKIQVPFLHIIDAVANQIKAQGLNKVALLGTSFTMQDNFYIDGLKQRGIEAIVPDVEQQKQIHHIIFDELCVGKFLEKSKKYYLDVIDDLKQKDAQGVILGCTEIGLLIQQSDSDLLLLDSSKLHTEMAVDFILSS